MNQLEYCSLLTSKNSNHDYRNKKVICPYSTCYSLTSGFTANCIISCALLYNKETTPIFQYFMFVFSYVWCICVMLFQTIVRIPVLLSYEIALLLNRYLQIHEGKMMLWLNQSEEIAFNLWNHRLRMKLV